MAHVTAVDRNGQALERLTITRERDTCSRERAEQAAQSTPTGLFGRLRAGLGSIFSPRQAPSPGQAGPYDANSLTPSVKRPHSSRFDEQPHAKRIRGGDGADEGASTPMAQRTTHSMIPYTDGAYEDMRSNLLVDQTPAKDGPIDNMAFPLRKRQRTRDMMERALRDEDARRQGFLPPMTEAQIAHRALLDRDYSIVCMKYPAFKIRPDRCEWRQLATKGDLEQDNVRNRSTQLPGGPMKSTLGKRKEPDTPAEAEEPQARKRQAKPTTLPPNATRTTRALQRRSPVKGRSALSPPINHVAASSTNLNGVISAKGPFADLDVPMEEDAFFSKKATSTFSSKQPFIPNLTGTFTCPSFSDSEDDDDDEEEIPTPTATQPMLTPRPTSTVMPKNLFSTTPAAAPAAAPLFMPTGPVFTSSTLFKPSANSVDAATSSLFKPAAAPPLAPSAFFKPSTELAPVSEAAVSASSLAVKPPVQSALFTPSTAVTPSTLNSLNAGSFLPVTKEPPKKANALQFFSSQNDMHTWLHQVAEQSLVDAGTSKEEDLEMFEQALKAFTHMFTRETDLENLIHVGEDLFEDLF